MQSRSLLHQVRFRPLRLCGGAELNEDEIRDFLATDPVDPEEAESRLMEWFERGDENSEIPPVNEKFKQAVEKALIIFEQEMIAAGNLNWKEELKQELEENIPQPYFKHKRNQTQPPQRKEQEPESLNFGSIFIDAAKNGNVTEMLDSSSLDGHEREGLLLPISKMI
eukprot:758347-Hanusia_phi.AAC.1